MVTFLYYSVWIILTLWCIFLLLYHKREPYSTIIWLLLVFLVPILGALLFLVFGPIRLERGAVKRKRNIEQQLSESDPTVLLTVREPSLPPSDLTKIPTEENQVFRLAEQISEYRLSTGNKVEIIVDPDVALASMQKAIEGAKQFIHLEYYIIVSDEVTEQLFDSLIEARRRGVEVRVLYDSLGSLSLKKIYFRRLTEHGVKVAGFLPLSAIAQRLNLNFRNHRKILVVDGKTAFTGSANIGKQYLGKRNDSQWRDNVVKVEGPVCLQLQDVFAKDWQFTTKEDLYSAMYCPVPQRCGDAVIQVLESGPDTRFQTLYQALFLAITSARSHILMTTPYFIPDSVMMTALTVAALRGVKVQLLLPQKNDLLLVQLASRSFYEALLEAGVEIYEYEPRILHAKNLIIDKKWTIIGSANMDARSFRLNFEINLLIYGSSVTEQAENLFEADLQKSNRVELATYLARPMVRRLLENACRLFSPIL
ncbi:MAG: cardiolipin synthase [Deltaproteobacteria bacterium]|nr:cardiolipin synthase [Deltaproteobacteria bacterium]